MQGGFGTFAWRVTASHVATYLVFGLLASTLLDYATYWDTPWMAVYRPMDAPIVALGPALQCVRGLVFAVVLYPFRDVFLAGTRGWLSLWGLLVGIGILSTYAAGPGSVEGVIYTALPWRFHLFGLPEVYGQSLAFSLCLVGWYRRPHRAWGVILGGLSGLAVLFGLAGALLPQP
ncbi:MAG: hypothetical protein R3F59_19035 [Myxococcota bacterium]